MDHIAEFPVEFTEPFRICFDLLSRSNIHIYEKDVYFVKKHWRGLVLLAITLTYHVSLLVYVCIALSNDTKLFELLFVVPVLMVATQGLLKAAIVVPNRAEIRHIILQLGSTWKTNDLTEQQMTVKGSMLKKLKLCHAVFYWMNIIGTWQYMLVPLFETLYRRFVLQQESELLFPFACSVPFDPKKNWMTYICVYIFEIYSMIHLVYIYLGAEFIMITLCSHISTQFNLLQEDLLHVGPSSNWNPDDVCPDNSGQGQEIRINDIIRRHQKLIILSQKLDDIFNKMIFINLLFATITICFFGFVAKTAHGPADLVNNIVGVFASIVPIFNLCYYAETLRGASAGIADSAFKTEWWNKNGEYRKKMYFIIMRSQIECSLTSMKYSPVNLKTFTTVLSTAWSYFSLVTNVYEG